MKGWQMPDNKNARIFSMDFEVTVYNGLSKAVPTMEQVSIVIQAQSLFTHD